MLMIMAFRVENWTSCWSKVLNIGSSASEAKQNFNSFALQRSKQQRLYLFACFLSSRKTWTKPTHIIQELADNPVMPLVAKGPDMSFKLCCLECIRRVIMTPPTGKTHIGPSESNLPSNLFHDHFDFISPTSESAQGSLQMTLFENSHMDHGLSCTISHILPEPLPLSPSLALRKSALLGTDSSVLQAWQFGSAKGNSHWTRCHCIKGSCPLFCKKWKVAESGRKQKAK